MEQQQQPFLRKIDGVGAPQGFGPLDDKLGFERILRTSPLIAVPPICAST